MKKTTLIIIFTLICFCGFSQTTLNENYDTLRSYSYVNVDAWYKPGKHEWINFVSHNLKYEPPRRKKAKKGSYKVQIEFTVDKDGSLSNIIPLTNYGFGLEDEAVRIISLTLKDWLPAEYNGKRIKSQKIQEIIIEVD